MLKAHAMKMYEEMEVWLHIFLTSALGGSKCWTLLPGKKTSMPTGASRQALIFINECDKQSKFVMNASSRFIN